MSGKRRTTKVDNDAITTTTPVQPAPSKLAKVIDSIPSVASLAKKKALAPVEPPRRVKEPKPAPVAKGKADEEPEEEEEEDEQILDDVLDGDSPARDPTVGRDRLGMLSFLSIPAIYGNRPITAPLSYTEFETLIPYLWFSEPSQNSHGGKVIYLNVFQDSYKSPCFQLADSKGAGLRAPFGLQDQFVAAGQSAKDPNRKNMMISLSDLELERVIRMLDDRTLSVAMERNDDFAGKTNDPQAIRYAFTRLVRPPKQSKKDKAAGIVRSYSNMVRLKVTAEPDAGKDNAVKVWVQTGRDDNGNIKAKKGTYRDLLKPCNIIPIVSIQSVYFAGNEWGLCLNLDKAIVLTSSRENSAPDDQFADCNIIEDDGEPVQPPPLPSTKPSASKTQQQHQKDPEYEEEEEEPAQQQQYPEVEYGDGKYGSPDIAATPPETTDAYEGDLAAQDIEEL